MTPTARLDGFWQQAQAGADSSAQWHGCWANPRKYGRAEWGTARSVGSESSPIDGCRPATALRRFQVGAAAARGAGVTL